MTPATDWAHQLKAAAWNFGWTPPTFITAALPFRWKHTPKENVTVLPSFEAKSIDPVTSAAVFRSTKWSSGAALMNFQRLTIFGREVLDVCVKFSRSLAEPGAGYAGADVLVDGAQGGA